MGHQLAWLGLAWPQLLLTTYQQATWMFLVLTVCVYGLLCVLCANIRTTPTTAASIPFLVRCLALCLLPTLSLMAPAGAYSSFFVALYDKAPLLIAYNSLVWWLTLPHETLWMDSICTWGVVSSTVVNALLLGRSAASPPALSFQSWVICAQAAVVAVLVTSLQWVARAPRGSRQGLWMSGDVRKRRDMLTDAWSDRIAGSCSSGCGREAQQEQEEDVPHQQYDSFSVQETVTCLAAGSSTKTLPAYEEALRLVQSQNKMSYTPVLQCCQVHVRLAGMELEQLQPGWQGDLAERLADHGWCLLNAAVRRGSIFVSFTIAGMRYTTTHHSAAGPGGAGGAGGSSAAAGAGGVMDLGAVTGPEQLLAQMGLRREQLPAGFYMTVQAVSDDGRFQRSRYTLLQEGSWAHEPLDSLRAAGAALAPGAEHVTEALQAANDPAAEGYAGPVSGAAQTNSSRGVATAIADIGCVSVKVACSSHGSAAGDGGSVSSGSRGIASSGATAPKCTIHAPDIVVGVRMPHGGSRTVQYEMSVRAWRAPSSPEPRDSPGASAAELWSATGLELRARPLGSVGKASELRMNLELQSNQDQGHLQSSSSGCGCSAAWAVTLWQQPMPASADLPAAILSRHASRRGNSGDSAAQATGEPVRRPQLVDLGLWRGHELLAARVVLLVPAECCSPPNAGQPEPWVRQLQELLQAQPAIAAQHMLVDLGLLLSGAFDRVVAVPPARTDGAMQSSAHPRGSGLSSAQQTLLVLDIGCSLLPPVLQAGACALAEYLWSALEHLGFEAEELLLHGTSNGADLPPLHAAITSGKAQVVDLVLSWYGAAQLPEPWLQPLRVAGAPAVLTPLVLASASSPSGSLLRHILSRHRQALAAWRVPVNGASGRDTAVAAGLRRIVFVVDVRMVLAPAAAAAAATGGWWLRWRKGQRTAVAPSHPRSNAGGQASSRGASMMTPMPGPTTADSRAPVVEEKEAPGSTLLRALTAFKVAALIPNVKGVPKSVETDLDMFVARQTRTRMLVVQWAIITFQIVSHTRTLLTDFDNACPVAAAAIGTVYGGSSSTGVWAMLAAARAVIRCAAGRLWWTGVEVAAVAFMSLTVALRRHTAVCVLSSVLHVLYQGLEGWLLPPSGIKATGRQMLIATSLFVVLNSCAFQPPPRLNALLRGLEGMSVARMHLDYNVTDQPRTAISVGLAVNMLGWVLSAVLRSRSAQLMEQQLLQHKQRQGSDRNPLAAAVPGVDMAAAAGTQARVVGAAAGRAACSGNGHKSE